MGEDFPFAWRNRLGIDGHDHALAAELLGGAAHKTAISDGCRIDRHLVGAGQKQVANIIERSDAAADGQRHKAGFGGASNGVEENAALLMGCGDVEKAKFIGACGVIRLGNLDGIARITKVDEVHTLDDAAILHIKAGNEPGFQHGLCSRIRRSA